MSLLRIAFLGRLAGKRCIRNAVLKKTMWNKGAGLPDGLLFFPPGLIPISGGCSANLLFEKQAEGADAFKTHVIAYFCYSKVAAGKEVPRLPDSFLCQVLVRRDLVDPGKKPVKMITGETSFPGKSVQVQRFPEIIIDIDLGRDDFFIYFGGDRHNRSLKFLTNEINSCFSNPYHELTGTVYGVHQQHFFVTLQVHTSKQ